MTDDGHTSALDFHIQIGLGQQTTAWAAARWANTGNFIAGRLVQPLSRLAAGDQRSVTNDPTGARARNAAWRSIQADISAALVTTRHLRRTALFVVRR